MVLNSLLSLEMRPVVSGGHTNQLVDNYIMIMLVGGYDLRYRKQLSLIHSQIHTKRKSSDVIP